MVVKQRLVPPVDWVKGFGGRDVLGKVGQHDKNVVLVESKSFYEFVVWKISKD